MLRIIGRTLVALMFCVFGITRMMNYDGMQQWALQRVAEVYPNLGIPGEIWSGLFAASLGAEVGGGILLLLGMEKVAFAALFPFLASITPLCHPFWAFNGLEQQAEFINFIKNIGLLGSLLIIFASSSSAQPKQKRA